MVFGYGILYGIAKYAGWDVSHWFLLFIALVHTVLLFGRKAAKKRKIPFDLFCILFLTGIFGCSFFVEEERMYFKELADWFVEWRFQGALESVYGWIFLYLLLALAGYVYGCVKKSARAKFGLSCLIFAGLIWQAVEGTAWELLPAAALLFVCLDGFTAGYRDFMKKQPALSLRDLFPFLACTICLICVLPVSEKPVSWEWAVSIWNGIETAVQEAANRIAYGNAGREFGVGTIGFAEDSGGFWGALTNGFSRQMLEISNDGFAQGRERYFTGVIKDVYKENALQWGEEIKYSDAFHVDHGMYSFGGERAGEETFHEMQWMLAERLHYLYRSGIEGTEGERFCRSRAYTIRYKSLRTDVLFYPANCFRVEPEEGGLLAASDNVFFDELKSSGDSYRVYGMQINLEKDALVDYMRNKKTMAGGTGQETLFEECVRTLGIDGEYADWLTGGEVEQLVEARREEIRAYDLKVPENVSDEMRALALNLTKDEENDYDKAMRIVRYLKKDGGFSYTYSQELAEQEDVMDEFLFHEKSGYCTYFATAAVLLCRLCGVPARLVEGVVVDYRASKDGVCPVEGRMAHAWTQVYIDGFGWLDVDATPGYETETADWSAVGAQYQKREAETEYVKATEVGQILQGEEGWQEKQRLSVFFWIFLIAILAFLLLLLVVWGVWRLMYKKASLDKKAEMLMRRLLENLRKRCFAMERGETLRMYKKRLLDGGWIENKTAEVFDWYEKVRYGGYMPMQTEIESMEELCKSERVRMKKERRRLGRKRVRKYR